MLYALKTGEEFAVETPSAERVRSIEEQGDGALYVGDGQSADCSDDVAFGTSCFLCESCNAGASSAPTKGSFARMRSCDLFLVAATTSHPPKFLGCVAGDWRDGRLLAHSLCVAHSARGHGVGPILLSNVARRERSYDLNVAKPLGRLTGAQARDFEARQAKLQRFYAGLGFRQVGEDTKFWRYRC